MLSMHSQLKQPGNILRCLQKWCVSHRVPRPSSRSPRQADKRPRAQAAGARKAARCGALAARRATAALGPLPGDEAPSARVLAEPSEDLQPLGRLCLLLSSCAPSWACHSGHLAGCLQDLSQGGPRMCRPGQGQISELRPDQRAVRRGEAGAARAQAQPQEEPDAESEAGEDAQRPTAPAAGRTLSKPAPQPASAQPSKAEGRDSNTSLQAGGRRPPAAGCSVAGAWRSAQACAALARPAGTGRVRCFPTAQGHRR